jgi:hypothetical protein
MVAKRENSAIIAGFCILIVITVSIAACTVTESKTNNPVTASEQTVPTSIVPVLVTAEPDLTQVQVAQPVKTGNMITIPAQQPSEPVGLTVNSAKKVLLLGTPDDFYLGPKEGYIFLILNITVKNNDVPEGFVFSNSSLIVRNPERNTGANRFLTSHRAIKKYLENRIIPPVTIQQNDSVTGQVLFEIYDSAEYQLNLIDTNKTVIASQSVNFNSLLTTESPVSLTIIDVNKIPNSPTNSPTLRTSPGRIFLVLNVTVKNNDSKNGFDFSWESTDLQDMKSSVYTLHSANNGPNLMTNFKTPLPPETTITPHGSITGQIVFIISDSTEYRMNLIDANKTIIASRIVHAA